MNYKSQLFELKKKMEDKQSTTLVVPPSFGFKDHDVTDFESVLSFFDWSLQNASVKIDLTKCSRANYQAISLLVLYCWALKDKGCTVSVVENKEGSGASAMWRKMGARGAFPVLFSGTQQFKGNRYKPMLAVRSIEDFKNVIETAEGYTNGFNVEYAGTLRYVLSELLYNTLEHGCKFGSEHVREVRIPSISQFAWYQKNNEIHFIIAEPPRFSWRLFGLSSSRSLFIVCE